MGFSELVGVVATGHYLRLNKIFLEGAISSRDIFNAPCSKLHASSRSAKHL
ncbi:hypothetical protein NTGHW29_40002 [Candidatus Nitrotoga sp. HW29]|nr:hypothetical protein NTGHW29_40002 [Candidatus Nitrotoga sp. HW29]